MIDDGEAVVLRTGGWGGWGAHRKPLLQRDEAFRNREASVGAGGESAPGAPAGECRSWRVPRVGVGGGRIVQNWEGGAEGGGGIWSAHF